MMNQHDVDIIQRIAKDLTDVEIPFFDTQISAGTGFPSPALDYAEHPIDLNKEFIKDKDCTFVARVRGDSMIKAAVLPGSHLIIDRSVTPGEIGKKNIPDMILGVVDNKFTVKFYRPDKGRIWLIPANDNYKPLLINESHNFYIWGIVTRIIINPRISELCTSLSTEITSIAPVKGYSNQDWQTKP